MAINASRLGFIVDMGIRGTGTAQFDYADASEQYLLPRPLIIYLKDDDRSMDHHQCLSCSNATIVKYLARFGAKSVVRLNRHEQLDPLLEREGVTHLHILSGDIAPPLTSRLPTVVNLVHTVFDAKVASTAHVPNVLYARVSPSVATWKTQKSIPVVPHIVRPAGTPPWTIEGPGARRTSPVGYFETVCEHPPPRRAAQGSERVDARDRRGARREKKDEDGHRRVGRRQAAGGAGDVGRSGARGKDDAPSGKRRAAVCRATRPDGMGGRRCADGASSACALRRVYL